MEEIPNGKLQFLCSGRRSNTGYCFNKNPIFGFHMLEAVFKVKKFVSNNNNNNNKRVAIPRQILLNLHRKKYMEMNGVHRKEYTENSIQKSYFDNIFCCFVVSFLCSLHKIFLAIATVSLFQHTKVFNLKMASSMTKANIELLL